MLYGDSLDEYQQGAPSRTTSFNFTNTYKCIETQKHGQRQKKTDTQRYIDTNTHKSTFRTIPSEAITENDYEKKRNKETNTEQSTPNYF